MPSETCDILLIDDNAEVLLVTADFLRHQGFTVLVAQDSSQGMRQLENKVGVVVLDVDLSGEDGLGGVDLLNLNQPDIPISLYTGLPHDDRQIIAMLKRGAAHYVNKTQPIHALLLAINDIRSKSGAASA